MVKMTTTEEQLLGVIAQEPGAEMPEGPFVTVVEQLLKKIADNGGGGGGGLAPEIIYAESHTTKEGYVIPVLTDTQITAAYNAVVAGKVVLVVDDLDTLSTQIYDASSIDGLAIRGIFTDTLILTYHIGGDIDAVKLQGGGGGSEPAIKTLSSADYNWPVNNPTSVALWLLDDGIYSKPATTVSITTDFQGRVSNDTNAGQAQLFIVSSSESGVKKSVLAFFSNIAAYDYAGVQWNIEKSTGYLSGNHYEVLSSRQIVDNLTSSSSAYVLSANQGRVLKGLIDALVFQNVITLSGTSGTLTDDEFALATDESKMVIIKIGNKVFRRGGSGTSWINYINVTTPTDTTVEFTNLYINTDSAAVNYKTWSIETVTPAGGGEAVTTLTTADYNYPENNPNSVALWLLDDGIYMAENKNVILRPTSNKISDGGCAFVLTAGTGKKTVVVFSSMDTGASKIYHEISSSGGYSSELYTAVRITNQLGSTSTTDALAAGQGKVLKDLIDTRVPAPTAGDADKFLKGDGTWAEAGGGGVNVVQSTGTSTTDVMSQDATTKMVFANSQVSVCIGKNQDTSNQSWRVAIGEGAGATNQSSIAIGHWCKCSSDHGLAIGDSANASSGYGSVALGHYSKAATKGEVSVGDTTGSFGYNNTGQRKITNVYGGENATDAVNVEQINTLIDAINSAANLNIAHIGNTGA